MIEIEEQDIEDADEDEEYSIEKYDTIFLKMVNDGITYDKVYNFTSRQKRNLYSKYQIPEYTTNALLNPINYRGSKLENFSFLFKVVESARRCGFFVDKERMQIIRKIGQIITTRDDN